MGLARHVQANGVIGLCWACIAVCTGVNPSVPASYSDGLVRTNVDADAGPLGSAPPEGTPITKTVIHPGIEVNDNVRNTGTAIANSLYTVLEDEAARTAKVAEEAAAAAVAAAKAADAALLEARHAAEKADSLRKKRLESTTTAADVSFVAPVGAQFFETPADSAGNGLVIVRPFSKFDGDKLMKSFDDWVKVPPCGLASSRSFASNESHASQLPPVPVDLVL